MATPDTTLDDFLEVMNDSGSPHYHDVNWLMGSVFCPDNNAANPKDRLPTVGITDHGPNFYGQADVTDLWKQVFTTWPDFALTPVAGCPRLYSPDSGSGAPRKIAIQAWLTGTQQGNWFPAGHAHYSPPLSDIKAKQKKTNLPACAVFTFDANDRIAHMAIYLDRYRMAQQLK